MLLVAFLQLTSAILVESFNIYIICKQESIEDIVLNYIALGFIAEIDNFYASALYKNEIKEAISKNDIKIYLEKDESSLLEPSTLIYKFFNALYHSYYYYFVPFSVILITTLFGTLCQNQK